MKRLSAMHFLSSFILEKNKPPAAKQPLTAHCFYSSSPAQTGCLRPWLFTFLTAL
jgi:hypothetical protein